MSDKKAPPSACSCLDNAKWMGGHCFFHMVGILIILATDRPV